MQADESPGRLKQPTLPRMCRRRVARSQVFRLLAPGFMEQCPECSLESRGARHPVPADFCPARKSDTVLSICSPCLVFRAMANRFPIGGASAIRPQMGSGNSALKQQTEPHSSAGFP